MPVSGEPNVRVNPAISAIDAATWDRLAAPDDATLNPFVTHAFLEALERSGSVGGRTGWRPCHLTLEQDGRITGAAPCYLKTHSKGEYIFDYGWAEAYERAGGQILSQAADRGAVHAGARPAAAGWTGRRRRGASADAAGRCDRAREAQSTPRRCTRRSSPKANGRAPALPAAGSSVPTSSSTGRTRAMPPSTISSRASPRASARRSAASAPQAIESRPRRSSTSRERDHRGALGRVLRASTWTPAAASGAGPISTASSSRCSAKRWPIAACW